MTARIQYARGPVAHHVEPKKESNKRRDAKNEPQARIEQVRLRHLGGKSIRELVPFNVQISRCIRENNITKAWDIYYSIPKQIQPDACTFNPLLNYYAKRNDLEGIEKVRRRMAKERVLPSVVTYNTLINAYVKAGKLEEAERTIDDMQKQNLQPNV